MRHDVKLHRPILVDSDPVGSDHLLRQSEVEEILGVAACTLEQWRMRGKGVPFCKLGRSVRYRASDVHAFVEGLERCKSTKD